MDGGGTRLLAVGARRKEIGKLGVAVLLHEPRHAVAPASAARFANDPERRPAYVGRGERAIARHGERAEGCRAAQPGRRVIGITAVADCLRYSTGEEGLLCWLKGAVCLLDFFVFRWMSRWRAAAHIAIGRVR